MLVWTPQNWLTVVLLGRKLPHGIQPKFSKQLSWMSSPSAIQQSQKCQKKMIDSVNHRR